MRLRELFEDGRIVQGVNTTADVGPNEIKIQAAKFGNTVTKDGVPPSMSSSVEGKSTNVIFHESQRIRTFEETLGEINKNTEIYVDMDGVLADFFGEWAKLMKAPGWRDIKDPEAALQKIREKDDFWLSLPMTDNAKNLLMLIKQVKGKYKILSSPLAGDPKAGPHKKLWVEKHLSFFPPEEVIIEHDKAKYATQPDGTPNILIDDYGVNIRKWDAAGGIGFKHKDHKFERTAQAIKQNLVGAVEGIRESLTSNTVYTALYLYEGEYYGSLLVEQMIFEGFLDSAKQYLGNQYDKTVADISGSINDFKQAGILIKDVLTSQKSLETTSFLLSKNIRMLNKNISAGIAEIGQTLGVPGATEKLTQFWNFLKEKIAAFGSIQGWKGFLAKLGIYGFVKFVSDAVSNANKLKQFVQSNLIDAITNKVTELGSSLASITMPAFFGFFSTLVTVKKYFMDVLSQIKQKIASVQVKGIATEMASSGATSSSAISTVINPSVAKSKPKNNGKYGAPVAAQKKNSDGTVKNALDIGNNIFGGKTIKR